MSLYPTLNQFDRMCKSIDRKEQSVRTNISNKFYTALKTLAESPKIFGLVDTRKTALTSFTWRLQLSEIYKGDKNLEEKLSAIKTRLTQAINSLLSNQLNTMLYSAFLAQLKTENVKGIGNVITIEKIFEPEEFDYDKNNFYLIDDDRQITRTISRADAQTEFLFVDSGLPRGGIMRKIMRAEILRWDNILEQGNYNRKLKGLLQLINKGTSEENQSAMEEAVQTAIKHNYVTTDENIELKLNELVAASGTSFKDFNDERKAEIAIALVGQANTSELPTNYGSRAALAILRMISADIFYADMNRVEALIKLLLWIDHCLNYDRNATLDKVPAEFKFNIEEEEDTEKNASALSMLPNTPFVVEEYFAKLKMSVPQDGQLVIVNGVIMQYKQGMNLTGANDAGA